VSVSVEIDGLTKRFGPKTALDGVSLGIRPGSVNALIGPNGSGKSTLMRVMAGLEEPDAGVIRFSVPEPELRFERTFVAQDPVMFSASVMRNVMYGLAQRGMPKEEAAERASEAITLTGLTGRADARGTRLSGGETRRAAVARAYALRAGLVLLDEPAAHLDPDGVRLIEDMIRRMRDEHGSTVVVITHSVHQAARIADTAALLYGGRLIEYGPADSLFNSPATELARDYFSGRMVC